MIDTLSISKQLQEGGISQNEADAIAKQMGRLIETDVASKQNLKETELILKKEIEEVKLNLQKEIEGVRLSLQKEIREVKLLLADKMNIQLRWMAGFLIGQTALLSTLIKLFG